MSESSQRAAISRHLKAGKSITQIEALKDFQCMRLGARIYELKQEGRDIHKYMARVGRGGKKKVACYYELRRGAAASSR